MKKDGKFLVLAVIFTMTMLCACAGKENEASIDRIFMPGFNFQPRCEIYSDLGVVFQKDLTSQIICFFDAQKNAWAPLCARVNCTHDSSGCDGYFGTVDFLAATEDGLYYIQWGNEMSDKNICRADSDGTNRSVLHRLRPAQLGCAGGCEEGYLFYAYYNQYDEEGEVLDKYHSEICLMDLKTGELVHVDTPDHYGGNILRATIDQGVLYYLYAYSNINLKDYNYEEISDAYERLRNEQVQELWSYDLTSGENTCLWSKRLTEAGGIILLGYGYLCGGCIDGEGHLEKLSTGETYTLDRTLTEGRVACMSDEGAILVSDGRIQLWQFQTGELKTLGTFRGDGGILIRDMTEHWVYAMLYDENGGYSGNYYMPRDRFMRGEMEWEQIPGIE